MGYQHIPNLYKEQAVLAGAECYALEKIHGTSAHVSFTRIHDEITVSFFSGGEKHENFIKLFNMDDLARWIGALVTDFPWDKLVVYGEAYGGRCQGMSATYGPELRFVAFEVCVDGSYLNIPKAHDIAKNLGFDFVFYKRIPTTLTAIDAERDAPSVQAFRNGITEPKLREGVVLFPLEQTRDHRGNRIFAKHKRDEFRETATPRVVTEKSIEIINAEKAANEFVTPMRLEHVLDKLPGHDITQMGTLIIPAMQEDILREGAGEVVDCPQLRREIARRTAIMYKERMKFLLKDCCDKAGVSVV
jgi:hypothetical protein